MCMQGHLEDVSEIRIGTMYHLQNAVSVVRRLKKPES